MRHITTSIEPKFIDSLKNENTDLFEDNISTVLDFLFTHYGKVPTREVKEKEHKVLATPLIPSDPGDYLPAHRIAQDSSRNS